MLKRQTMQALLLFILASPIIAECVFRNHHGFVKFMAVGRCAVGQTAHIHVKGFVLNSCHPDPRRAEGRSRRGSEGHDWEDPPGSGGILGIRDEFQRFWGTDVVQQPSNPTTLQPAAYTHLPHLTH